MRIANYEDTQKENYQMGGAVESTGSFFNVILEDR